MGVYIFPLTLIVVATYLVVRGVRMGIMAFGLKSRGVLTRAQIDCLNENESGLDRYYVSFSLEDGTDFKCQLKNLPKRDLRDGEFVDVVYDSKKPKRVILGEESVIFYMSTASFMIGGSMFLYNIATSLLMRGLL